MLVASQVPKLVTWRWAARLGVLAIIAAVWLIAPHLRSSTELVRMRNALVVESDQGSGFSWTPKAYPANFLLERGPVDPAFAEVANRLALRQQESDWQRVLVISKHLLGSAAPLTGGAIQSDLKDTYRRIVGRGQGYCGDFVRAFTAIALAAGMEVRWWAFSFDGFGGYGHIWLEVWNRDVGRWQLVDIFNNYYFVKSDGVPLSALELRGAFKDSPRTVSLKPLYAEARPGFSSEASAWEYFSKGFPEWYMWMGNNVFTYDRAVLVRVLGGVTRSLEQMGGILQGEYPGVLVYPTPDNQPQAQALRALRTRLWISALLGTIGLAVWMLSIVYQYRARRAVSKVA